MFTPVAEKWSRCTLTFPINPLPYNDTISPSGKVIAGLSDLLIYCMFTLFCFPFQLSSNNNALMT
ncbi:hypothetical protein NQ315_015767 [Exocentrus adspersus]|uniref:Uncharacterized protein n=1 Tax=Exocentrus adspersus TaxID=1586481 RepID=A0AAV8W3G5_9CUCU|nr:hypothetical protein NQ315_015767 [Exocentrus adspersus]